MQELIYWFRYYSTTVLQVLLSFICGFVQFIFDVFDMEPVNLCTYLFDAHGNSAVAGMCFICVTEIGSVVLLWTYSSSNPLYQHRHV